MNREHQTMLGENAPSWLVITSPKYTNTKGAYESERKESDSKQRISDEELEKIENLCKRRRISEGIGAGELARRFGASRESVPNVEEDKRINVIDWLRLWGFYKDTLSITLIKEGKTEEENSYITLLNVNIRESHSTQRAAHYTREHLKKETKKKSQQIRRQRRREGKDYN